MATCNACGQELKGVKYEVGEFLFCDSAHGLQEVKVVKVLPPQRYRILFPDSKWASGLWEERYLFRSVEDYMESKEKEAVDAMEKILEEKDMLWAEYRTGTIVKARFKPAEVKT
jgi:hypothetical protein